MDRLDFLKRAGAFIAVLAVGHELPTGAAFDPTMGEKFEGGAALYEESTSIYNVSLYTRDAPGYFQRVGWLPSRGNVIVFPPVQTATPFPLYVDRYTIEDMSGAVLVDAKINGGGLNLRRHDCLTLALEGPTYD